jgi:hypothetical protein
MQLTHDEKIINSDEPTTDNKTKYKYRNKMKHKWLELVSCNINFLQYQKWKLFRVNKCLESIFMSWLQTDWDERNLKTLSIDKIWKSFPSFVFICNKRK